VFHSTKASTSPLLPSKNSHTYACACTQFQSTLCLCPMPHLGNPHQIHIWKKGFYWAMDLNWLWFGNLTHAYKFVKMCTYNTHFLY
jgi:hypothetical protein